ncbi:MAG: Acyl-CoA dehydrogenase [Pelotomaculum sp. PtaB.Bin104]|nr:MAG: Acyl-CoA dehydrogenase [Pelotomaculum sp. PtaB.Bin104]
MSLFLTEEQELIRQGVIEFTKNEVKPRAMEIHRANDIPMDLVKRAGDLGYLSILVPKELGGLGLGLTEACIIGEEVSKESPGFGMCLIVSMATLTQLILNPIMKEKYLEKALDGEVLVEYASGDPLGATNFSEWPVFARKDGDDWILNGTRLFASNNGVATVCCVVGYTEDRQLKLWMVEKGNPGMDNSYVEKKMGLSGQNSGTVTFSNCRVSKDMVVDFDPNPEHLVASFLMESAVALGIAEGVLEKTIEFTKLRTNRFKPLASMQAIAHKLAKNATLIELGRAIIYDTCRLAEENRPISKMIHMAKAWVCEMAVDVARDCIQLHGGLGYMEDTGICRYMDDAMGTTIADMPSDTHYSWLAYLMGLPDPTVEEY